MKLSIPAGGGTVSSCVMLLVVCDPKFKILEKDENTDDRFEFCREVFDEFCKLFCWVFSFTLGIAGSS